MFKKEIKYFYFFFLKKNPRRSATSAVFVVTPALVAGFYPFLTVR